VANKADEECHEFHENDHCHLDVIGLKYNLSQSLSGRAACLLLLIAPRSHGGSFLRDDQSYTTEILVDDNMDSYYLSIITFSFYRIQARPGNRMPLCVYKKEVSDWDPLDA